MPADKSYATYTKDTCPYNPSHTPADDAHDNLHAPLKVLSPSIVDALIGQSSTSPGETNTITATLSVNTPVRPDATEGIFVLSGFNGALATCGPVALFDASNSAASAQSVFSSSPDGAPGTGLWNCEDQSLTLHITAMLEPCDTYVFSWRVTNPVCSQTCTPISLMTKHLEFQPVGCGASEDCKHMIAAGMPALVPMISDIGTRCPMTVVAPMLTVMKVSECTKVCGMQNKLDVVLEANVAMMAKNSITIGGFMAADGCMFMYLYVLDSM